MLRSWGHSFLWCFCSIWMRCISVWLFHLPHFAQWSDVRGGFLVKDVLPGKGRALYCFLILCSVLSFFLFSCSGLIIHADMMIRRYFDDESFSLNTHPSDELVCKYSDSVTWMCREILQIVDLLVKTLNSCVAIFNDILSPWCDTALQDGNLQPLSATRTTLISESQGEQPWNLTISRLKNNGIFSNHAYSCTPDLCEQKQLVF